jgi:hypothetical protein
MDSRYLHHLVGLSPNFRSEPMQWRGARINEAKKFSKQLHRDLERDRAYLERRESQLVRFFCFASLRLNHCIHTKDNPSFFL